MVNLVVCEQAVCNREESISCRGPPQACTEMVGSVPLVGSLRVLGASLQSRLEALGSLVSNIASRMISLACFHGDLRQLCQGKAILDAQRKLEVLVLAHIWMYSCECEGYLAAGAAR